MICHFSMTEKYMPAHWWEFIKANREKDLRGTRKKELEDLKDKKKNC